jgi:hypothetical protein
MPDNPVQAEMRLYALELMFSSLFSAFHVQTGDPAASLERLRSQIIQKTREQPFPGLDAALSDLASGELEEAFERLIRMQADFLQLPAPKDR